MKNKFLTSGSIIAAVLASLCCIGPIVLVGLGVGSVAFFSRFDAYRPYLIAIALLLLVPAFYLTYRKREVKCEDGSCKIENAGKWNRISVWIAVLIVAGFTAFPYLGFAKEGQNQLNNNPKFQTVELRINNMDCEACALGLQSELKRKNGIVDAYIYYKESKGVFKFNPKIITAKKISYFLTEDGYPAKTLK